MPILDIKTPLGLSNPPKLFDNSSEKITTNDNLQDEIIQFENQNDKSDKYITDNLPNKSNKLR